MFRAASSLRPTIQILLIVLGFVRLFAVFISAFAATSQPVPFIVCKESATWTRPTAVQQAKIWNDPRYADHGANAYEWNHEFLFVPPHSANIQYRWLCLKSGSTGTGSTSVRPTSWYPA